MLNIYFCKQTLICVNILYLGVPYVPVWVTRCALIKHWYTSAPSLPNIAARHPFFFFSVSLWNDLADPVFDDVRLAGFGTRADDFLSALFVGFYFAIHCFIFLLVILWCGFAGLGSLD